VKLEPANLKPLMVFRPIADLAGGEFVLDEVKDGMAVGRFFFHSSEEVLSVAIEKLLDPKQWMLDTVMTCGTMAAKIQQQASLVEWFQKQTAIKPAPVGAVEAQKAGAVAHLFEHRDARDPIRGCAKCNLPYHEGAHRSPEGVMRELESLRNEVASKYLLRATVEDAEVGRAVKALEAERDELLKEVQGLRIQNWKLTDNIAEHEKALADVKAGFELELPGQWPARLDALLPAKPVVSMEDEDFFIPRRIKVSLNYDTMTDVDYFQKKLWDALKLPEELRRPVQPTKSVREAICSCNGCGDSLKDGEVMVCKQCHEIMLLKDERLALADARRVLRVKPLPGRVRDFPSHQQGLAEVIGVDYGLPGGDRTVHLVVVRLPPERATPDAVEMVRRVQEKMPEGTVVIVLHEGSELTVLELP
jgi:hypothetical protein